MRSREHSPPGELLSRIGTELENAVASGFLTRYSHPNENKVPYSGSI